MQNSSPSTFSKSAPLYIHATDTCYGFAARYDDLDAIELIQTIKGRKADKPFSLLFKDIDMLENFCEVSEEQKAFILSQTEPSSFILRKKGILNNYFPGQSTISARIENDNFPVKLSTILNTPVTSTSVNRTDNPPLYSADEIAEEFKDVGDEVVLVDSEEIEKIPPSSIWDLTGKEIIKLR